MTTTIKVQGMSCNHCVAAVSKTLSNIEGISDVKVDLAKGEATFDRTESVSMEEIKRQIELEGYTVG